MFKYLKIFILLFLLISCLKTITVEQDNIPVSNADYGGSIIGVENNECTSLEQPSVNSLLITEVHVNWIEIYNKTSQTQCLGDYTLRALTKNSSTTQTYSLSNFLIQPQSYAIIRFTGNYRNYATQIHYIDGPGFRNDIFDRVGFFELLYQENTTDYVGFCQSGNIPVPPKTGSFSGCISYPTSSSSGAFARNISLNNIQDTDSSSDWTLRKFATFGGKNDVTSDVDNDQDGIPDANEEPGTTFAGMPLYDWGARKDQRDLFVYINYMEGWRISKGLDPRLDSLEKIKLAFKTNNIHIHFDVGNRHSTSVNPNQFNLSGKSHEVKFNQYVDLSDVAVKSSEVPTPVSITFYKNYYMPLNRFNIFHYALFAHLSSSQGKISLADGKAEIYGNDIGLFLGRRNFQSSQSIYLKNYIALVLFHEIGHNLNLYHGGNESINNKPNFFSTMNYMYAYTGVPVTNRSTADNFYDRYQRQFNPNATIREVTLHNSIYTDSFVIDYSHGTLPDINESKLSEINPLGTALGNIDWNFNGISTATYSFDVDQQNGKTLIKDYDEWKNLILPFDSTPNNTTSDNNNMNDLIPSVTSSSSPQGGFHYLNQDEVQKVIECSLHGDHIIPNYYE